MIAVELNDRWRVRDDGLQWIIERRVRRSDERSTGYVGRSYCTQRRTLKQCIHDYCGECNATLRPVENLPDRYPYKFAARG